MVGNRSVRDKVRGWVLSFVHHPCSVFAACLRRRVLSRRMQCHHRLTVRELCDACGRFCLECRVFLHMCQWLAQRRIAVQPVLLSGVCGGILRVGVYSHVGLGVSAMHRWRRGGGFVRVDRWLWV